MISNRAIKPIGHSKIETIDIDGIAISIKFTVNKGKDIIEIWR
jgi:hypothetical protein